MQPLVLFVDAFFTSPFDFRCHVALEEKGLDFAVSRVMVTEDQGLTPSYKELSLTARVPGLMHGDFWLAESLAIIEYLEEAFPAPEWPRLYPADVRARARARQVLAFFGSDLQTLVSERPSWMIFYPTKAPPLSPAARAVAGDLTWALLRLARTGETLAPALQAFVDANLARPSVRRFLEHERPPNPPRSGRRVTT